MGLWVENGLFRAAFCANQRILKFIYLAFFRQRVLFGVFSPEAVEYLGFTLFWPEEEVVFPFLNAHSALKIAKENLTLY